MILIDSLSYSSKLRYKNPEEKFVFAMSSLVICVATKSILAALTALIINGWLIVRKGGIPLSYYVKYLLVPLVFLFFSTLILLVNISKIPLDAYAIPIGEYYLTSSLSDMYRGIGLIVTALGAVSCLYFLAMNTPMTEICEVLTIGEYYLTSSLSDMYRGIGLIVTALGAVSCLYFLAMNTPMTEICEVLKRMHCPTLFIELMLLTYRFIFILLEVASAILTAQKSRLGNRNFRTSLDSFGKMVSILFIRSLKKSTHLYDAMESRCYNGELNVLRDGSRSVCKEIVWIVLYEMVLLCIAVFGF